VLRTEDRALRATALRNSLDRATNAPFNRVMSVIVTTPDTSICEPADTRLWA
jgi:hypothetical protein